MPLTNGQFTQWLARPIDGLVLIIIWWWRTHHLGSHPSLKKNTHQKLKKKSDKTFHSMSGDRTRSLICFRLFLFCVVFHKFCFVIGWRNPPRR